jgi:hypothetical protein
MRARTRRQSSNSRSTQVEPDDVEVALADTRRQSTTRGRSITVCCCRMPLDRMYPRFVVDTVLAGAEPGRLI